MVKFVIDRSITQYAVSCLATDLGWIFFDKILPTDTNPLEIVWGTREQENFMHYVEDDWIGTHYLIFDGPAAESLAASFDGSSVKLYGLPEVLWLAAQEDIPEAQHQIASWLAVLAPREYEPAVFEAFNRLLHSSSPHVRQQTIVAVTYPGWSQFKSLLQRIKVDDPDDFVRWRAETALEAYASKEV